RPAVRAKAKDLLDEIHAPPRSRRRPFLGTSREDNSYTTQPSSVEDRPQGQGKSGRECRPGEELVRGALAEHPTEKTVSLVAISLSHLEQHCRATEKRNELAPPHSITSSVRSRNDSGMPRPRALAVLRFTTSLNLVGYCTGRLRKELFRRASHFFQVTANTRV